MQNINLGFHSKARVWIKDSPSIIYPSLDILTKEIQTGLSCKLGTRRAALEIIIPVGPRVCYGLLGAEFIPNNSGNLSVEIRVSTDSESIFKNSIAAQFDAVRFGLPMEYSQSVIEGISNSLNNQVIEIIGSGVIRFDRAAHGEISSSKKFFRNIASIVMQLLLLDENNQQEEITEIVKTYSLL